MEDKNVTYVKATSEHEAREKALGLKKNKKYLDRVVVVRAVFHPRVVGVKFPRAPASGARGDWRLLFHFAGEDYDRWSAVKRVAKDRGMGAVVGSWEERCSARSMCAIEHQLRVKGRTVMTSSVEPWLDVSNGEYSVTFLPDTAAVLVCPQTKASVFSSFELLGTSTLIESSAAGRISPLKGETQ
jgi:hypothetical protein